MLDTLFKGSDVTYKVTLGESGSLLTGPMKALLCGVGIDRRQARGPSSAPSRILLLSPSCPRF